MAASDQLKQLVEQMPDPDNRGMYTENIDKESIEKTIEAIARGGKDNLLGLIEMLDEAGSREDVKPHYALHCVVNHSLITRNEKLRRDFCEVMAGQLENEELLSYNRAFLCQELQWAGRDEACPALGKALLNEDLTDAAATALAAIGGERAASQLRPAVAKAEGKCRLNLIDALAALADPQSAPIFREALRDMDREVRIAAAAGLANLGQADAADSLLNASALAQGWERTQLTKSCLVLAEKLAAANNQGMAKRIYEELHRTRTTEQERHVREACQRAGLLG